MEIYSNLADVVVHKTYRIYIFNNDIHTTFTKMLTIYITGKISNTSNNYIASKMTSPARLIEVCRYSTYQWAGCSCRYILPWWLTVANFVLCMLIWVSTTIFTEFLSYPVEFVPDHREFWLITWKLLGSFWPKLV